MSAKMQTAEIYLSPKELEALKRQAKLCRDLVERYPELEPVAAIVDEAERAIAEAEKDMNEQEAEP